jgi:RNA polymerase sigma-70 factor, ECF subfamily
LSVPPRSLVFASAAIDLQIDAHAPDVADGQRLVDTSLAARVRAREPAAFRTLFDRFGIAIWRFIHDLVGDSSQADEGLQETFFRAFSRIDQLRDESRLMSWLLGIARNVAMEAIRARRRDHPAGSVVLSEDAAHEPSHGPEGMLLGRETQALVDRALAGLGEERRAALLLRVDHGLPYEEISQVMGWSVPKVKNEIHRARLKLREALEQFHGGAR